MRPIDREGQGRKPGTEMQTMQAHRGYPFLLDPGMENSPVSESAIKGGFHKIVRAR
jgi:hypothetical protein